MKNMHYANVIIIKCRIAGKFWREKFSEILEKTNDFRKYISENSVLVVLRDGSLEVPHAEVMRYNKYLFRIFA